MKSHIFKTHQIWQGNYGEGTPRSDGYGRDFVVEIEGKPPLLGSADPEFRGDGTRWSPEDMMVSSVSSCHMLWYLKLCAVAGVRVMAYVDDPEGELIERSNTGYFERVTLRPKIVISPESSLELAVKLHTKAHELCFIANSVNFDIYIEPEIVKQE